MFMLYNIYNKHNILPVPVDSIRLAVFTVSPKRQYLGIFKPTTPAQTGPESWSNHKKKHNLMWKLIEYFGLIRIQILYTLASRNIG